MDLQIALLLGQDGITNGAIYALLALALVLVFAVTRVIFIPQGEFVAFGAKLLYLCLELLDICIKHENPTNVDFAILVLRCLFVTFRVLT